MPSFMALTAGHIVAVRCDPSPKEPFWLATVIRQAAGRSFIRWWERVGTGKANAVTKYKAGATEQMSTVDFADTVLYIMQSTDYAKAGGQLQLTERGWDQGGRTAEKSHTVHTNVQAAVASEAKRIPAERKPAAAKLAKKQKLKFLLLKEAKTTRVPVPVPDGSALDGESKEEEKRRKARERARMWRLDQKSAAKKTTKPAAAKNGESKEEEKRRKARERARMWRLDQKSVAKKTTKSAAAKTTSRLGVRQKTVAKKPAAKLAAKRPAKAKSSAAKSWLAKVAQQQKTTLAKPGGANKFPELQMALAMAAKRTEALQRLPKGIKAAKAAKAAGRPSLMPVDRTLQSMQPAKQPAKPAKKPVQKPAAAKRGQPANAYGQLKAVAKTAALKPKPVVKAKPSLKAVIKAKPSRPKAKASSSVVMPKPAVKSKKTVVVVKKSAEKKRRAAGPPAIAKGKLDKTKVVFHRAGISGISGVSKYPTGKGGPSAVKSLKTISDGDLVAVRCPASPKESFWLATVKKQAKSKTTICWWERVGKGNANTSSKYKMGATEQLSTQEFGETVLYILRSTDFLTSAQGSSGSHPLKLTPNGWQQAESTAKTAAVIHATPTAWVS